MCTYVDEEIHIKPNKCCCFFSPDIKDGKVHEEHKYFEFSRRHLSAAEKEKHGGSGDFFTLYPHSSSFVGVNHHSHHAQAAGPFHTTVGLRPFTSLPSGSKALLFQGWINTQ